MTAVSDKVVWKIKKEDFEKRDFSDCKFQLGEFQWAIGDFSIRISEFEKVAYFDISWERSSSGWTSFINVHHRGNFTLLGYNEKHNAVHSWSAVALRIDDLRINLPIDNSVLSFDAKYLFPDGTYRLEFQVAVKDLSIEFGSPNHELLFNDADTGCLQIDEHKIYVSKTYLSTISPYFKALFFGDFKEKTQEVIVLEEVHVEHFMQFLAHSYTMLSNHRKFITVGEVLELADKYLCKSVFVSCDELLENQDYFDIDELRLSNRYKLSNACEKAVASLSVDELEEYLTEIMSDPDSDYVRRLITERLEKEANERKLLEDLANKRKLLEDAANKRKLLEDVANKRKLLEGVANKRKLLEDLANKRKLLEDVANKRKRVCTCTTGEPKAKR